MNDRNAEHGTDLHQHLLHMLGATDHQDAAKIIAGLHGQCLTLNRMADTAERRDAQMTEQLRTLWMVVRETGAAGGVRLTREMMATTDWSEARLERSDDFATGDVILAARLQGDALADDFDDDDKAVEVGSDVGELQRALVAISQALACDCELDDMLHRIDGLQTAMDDERSRATRYANGSDAATAAVAKIAESLGVRADLPRILDQIDAIRLNGAGLGLSPDTESMARALASRFVPKTEPQRLAALQSAIVTAINAHRVQPADTVGEQVRPGDRPGGARPVVTITVAGIVGVGKSAIALTILDALRAAGLSCEWADEAEERDIHGDPSNWWRGMKGADVPLVRLVEVVEPRAVAPSVSAVMAAGIGARRITAARLHQLTGEGYSRAADQRYVNFELTRGAMAYLEMEVHVNPGAATPLEWWPWGAESFKPKGVIENLERAGALIAAEIDRLEAGTVRETRKATPPGSVYTGHATIPVALVGEREERAQAAQQEETRAAEFEARAALADDVAIGAADRPLDGLPPGYAPKPDAPVPVESLGRDADWKRDDETTFLTILLIGADETGFANGISDAAALARIATWTDEECQAVEDYCRGVHIQASDHDDFELPAKPAVLGWQPQRWGLPMDTAPKDGNLVRLLVDFSEHDVVDGLGPHWTIGAWPGEGDEKSEWQFAGWCWTHDHFTEGKGTPIGWLPMIEHERTSEPAPSSTFVVMNQLLPDGASEIIERVIRSKSQRPDRDRLNG